MPSGANAFGAGNIPSLAAIEGTNFRHGDIEDTLATLVMSSGSFLSRLTGGKKFDDLAIKQVYFGNWLRDYSQAIDLGTLTKGINPELIRIVLWIMAFGEFGYGTNEFEVTSEKLGVYRAEEHIDNPKGYGEGLDARDYDKRLRGPVDPEELEVDRETGMKNYICNENGNWPTSSEYVRTSLHKCIELGRKARDDGTELDQFEAFRLLGQALHTLEDFSAHSNYCELVLISMGYTDVFPHVGENCTIELNGEIVYPVVTGTFGGQDFLHSLMGGAQDSLSQMEIADIESSLNNSAASVDSGDRLKKYLNMIPNFSSGNESEEDDKGSFFDQIDQLKNSCHESSDPTEIIAQVYPYIEFRDNAMKKIDKFISSIPGLNELRENISEAMTIFIMGNIQPIISPLLQQIVDGLHGSTEAIVNGEDQFLVWTDPNYDNPTHSQLSKDHFASYLNEPAGKIATVVVSYVVPMIVQAWEDTEIDMNEVTDKVLQVFHHPAMARTSIHRQMRGVVEEWVNNLDDADAVLAGFTAEGVRNGQNLKKAAAVFAASDDRTSDEHTDSCGHSFGFNIPKINEDEDYQTISKFNSLNISQSESRYDEENERYPDRPNRYTATNEQESSPQRHGSSYDRNEDDENINSYGYNRREDNGEERPTYGNRHEYNEEEQPSYEYEGKSNEGREEEETPYEYNRRNNHEEGEERPSYDNRNENDPAYGYNNRYYNQEGGQNIYGGHRDEEDEQEYRRLSYRNDEEEESRYGYRRDY